MLCRTVGLFACLLIGALARASWAGFVDEDAANAPLLAKLLMAARKRPRLHQSIVRCRSEGPTSVSG